MMLIAFDSTHHAIHMEVMLEYHGIESETIPTPKTIAARCALSIICDLEFHKEVIGIVQQERIEVQGFYCNQGEQYEKIG